MPLTCVVKFIFWAGGRARKIMKFSYKQFTCDVDVFKNEDGILLRFYDSSKEQSEEEIANLVIVDSGYGFLCLKIKGEDGLISGYLNRNIFASDEMVYAVIEFLENLFPKYTGGYIPYHIDRVQFVDYIEYNGEY